MMALKDRLNSDAPVILLFKQEDL